MGMKIYMPPYKTVDDIRTTLTVEITGVIKDEDTNVIHSLKKYLQMPLVIRKSIQIIAQTSWPLNEKLKMII